MNPEEGDLRPQLLDRFAFSVQIEGLIDTEQRVQIMERRIAFEIDPDDFCVEWAGYEKQLSDQISRGRKLVNDVRYTRRDLMSIAGLTSSFKIDGHRADLVILRGAQAHAALNGRAMINDNDIVLAAELALPHRIKGRLFQETEINPYELEERLEQVQSEMGPDEMGELMEDESSSDAVKKKP
jgi:Mg-chelatase subunit ChlI